MTHRQRVMWCIRTAILSTRDGGKSRQADVQAASSTCSPIRTDQICSALGRPRAFRRGASIMVQGDHSDAVLVLLRGLVKVTLDTADGHEIVLYGPSSR